MTQADRHKKPGPKIPDAETWYVRKIALHGRSDDFDAKTLMKYEPLYPTPMFSEEEQMQKYIYTSKSNLKNTPKVELCLKPWNMKSEGRLLNGYAVLLVVTWQSTRFP